LGYLQALVLGVVQGLTEFLPISSDGHLALTYTLFNSRPDLAFEVFLHAATLIATVIYFWPDIMRLLRSLGPAGRGSADRRLVYYIVLATVISGVLALAFKKLVEEANLSLMAIGAGFLLTSAMLVAAEVVGRRARRRSPEQLGAGRVSLIAIAQAAAAFPGASRSGLTIGSGMLSGLDRETAARFSFLVGIPVIGAATLYEGKDIVTGVAPMPPVGVSLVGFLAAGISGYLAIRGLLALVRTRSLYVFAVYTALVGLITIAWGFVA
jgi:undecaprenyl-diphosphatase